MGSRTISDDFEDVPDDMHRDLDIRHMENLTPPLDSANPKVMETNPRRVKQIGVTLESNRKHGLE